MEIDRFKRLCPGGIPRWQRWYHNPGSSPPWSYCYTGAGNGGYYRVCSSDPYHPQGIGMSGEVPGRRPADAVPGEWVPCRVGKNHPQEAWGVRINYEDLPPKVQKSALEDEAVRRGWMARTGKPDRVRVCEGTPNQYRLVWAGGAQ